MRPTFYYGHDDIMFEVQVGQFFVDAPIGAPTDEFRDEIAATGRFVQVEVDALPPDVPRTLYRHAIAGVGTMTSLGGHSRVR
jgi:hypothetical protein